MSASLLSFLSPSKIEETIPDGVLPSSVTSGSVVQMRNRSRYIATSGATYAVPTGSNIVQFKVTGNDYLDLPTAVLHFKIAITPNAAAAGTNAYMIQEGIFSIINRCRVALNSVIVSDTDNVHTAAHAKVLNTMPRQVYDSADGQYMGLYKKTRTLLSPSAISANTTPYPTFAQVATALSGYYSAAGVGGAVTDAADSSFAFPMSLICPFFSMKTFLPLRNCGNLELTLFLETPANCFRTNDGTSSFSASAAYTLSDVSLEIDSVQLAAPVVQMIDRLTADVSETGGVVLPVSVEVVQNINYSGSGQKSVSISRGTTALTALTLLKRLQASIGQSSEQWLSTFRCFGQTRSQIRLGSRLYPTTATDSLARAFTETRHAYGLLNNMLSGGLVDRRYYESSLSAAAADITDQAAFTYAYNFRRVRSEDLALDGENSIQSGSIIQYDFTDAPVDASGSAGNAVLTAVIESLRYVELKGSSVNVTGM